MVALGQRSANCGRPCPLCSLLMYLSIVPFRTDHLAQRVEKYLLFSPLQKIYRPRHYGLLFQISRCSTKLFSLEIFTMTYTTIQPIRKAMSATYVIFFSCHLELQLFFTLAKYTKYNLPSYFCHRFRSFYLFLVVMSCIVYQHTGSIYIFMYVCMPVYT